MLTPLHFWLQMCGYWFQPSWSQISRDSREDLGGGKDDGRCQQVVLEKEKRVAKAFPAR